MADFILYHQLKPGLDCADGIAAAWVVHKKYPAATVLGARHGEPPPVKPHQGDRLFIVDFCYGDRQIRDWQAQGVTVTIIDHHKTALESLSAGILAQPTIHFSMAECGATLAWRTLFPERPLPDFLTYVRDRDLWQNQLPHTEEIHEAMGKIGRTFAMMDELEQMDILTLVPIGRALLIEKQEAIAAAVARVEFGAVAGYPDIPFVALSVEEDGLTSDICARLYGQYPQAPFVACLTSNGNWSLRSDQQG
ncbi:hypothetical protein, partial [Picosynechococcus sp. NKBG042902]|uniref:hypothetical protein n=1 Tax=Picosynechococcus sp. NKBG042902 TaxID=490193 RepID=UPI00190FA6B2